MKSHDIRDALITALEADNSFELELESSGSDTLLITTKAKQKFQIVITELSRNIK